MRVDSDIRFERLPEEIINIDPKITRSFTKDDSLSDDEVDPPSPKEPNIEEEDGDDLGSNSDSENKSSKLDPRIEAAYNEYMAYVNEHKGFDVNLDLIPPGGFPGYCGIYPVDFDEDPGTNIAIKQATYLAIKRYNELVREGSRLELDEIIKANASATIYYITFSAKEVDTGNRRNYQTKVFHMLWGDKARTSVFFVRPEPEPGMKGEDEEDEDEDEEEDEEEVDADEDGDGDGLGKIINMEVTCADQAI